MRRALSIEKPWNRIRIGRGVIESRSRKQERRVRDEEKCGRFLSFFPRDIDALFPS